MKEAGDDPPTVPESPSTRQSASILEYLERANLFLVSLDDERNWYRYHHLFADLLRARLHQSQPDLGPSPAYAGFRLVGAERIHPRSHPAPLRCARGGHAADLIERYGPVRWAESDPSVVQMADSLPPEMLIARPKIGLYQAWLLIHPGLHRKGPPFIE